MSKWVLVPVQRTSEMVDAAFTEVLAHKRWAAELAARPPIPRAVWDAMVERLRDAVLSSGHSAWVSDDAADAALRAALGQPVVEGDAP